MTRDGVQVRIGADIGGTFTDIALEIGGRMVSAKVLTTHAAPEQGLVDGLRQAVRKAGTAFSEIDAIIHGTTLATNALIERRGARTALVTTRGFRDVIEMRTENRFEQYDLDIVLPEPLVPRDERFTIGERVDANGRVLVPLDEAELEALTARIADGPFESVAIGLIHSYANGSHERRIGEALMARKPELSISISSEVSPQMREFQRFNTVCANAYVKPLMESYLRRLVGELRNEGALCPVFMMHSGGGVISVDAAIEYPVRLLESGPAGGAIFAAHIAGRYGLGRVLSYDMGGTTAKICLIEDQAPRTARTFEVARTYRFKKGSGMPISIPVIEMVEIGAGGGSISTVDSMRQIRVGPQSAGSEPGPACYGRGGDRPTVTDADLLLGKLDPEGFAGGEMALDPGAAEGAVSGHLAKPLEIDSVTAAFGLCEVVDENMSNAARMHAVENGMELSDYTMIAFGGAAPLHAGRLCEKLGVGALLVPPGAGVGSAIGFLRASFAFESVRSVYLKLAAFDHEKVNAVLEDLKEEATAFVHAGAPGATPALECMAYMRYAGQGWEVPVPVEARRYGAGEAAVFRAAFEQVYEQLFGRIIDKLDIEIVSWSLRASSEAAPAPRVAIAEAARDVAAETRRETFDARASRFLETAVVVRASLRPGDRVAGPAAIVEDETTTIVTAAQDAVMQADGCLLVRARA